MCVVFCFVEMLWGCNFTRYNSLVRVCQVKQSQFYLGGFFIKVIIKIVSHNHKLVSRNNTEGKRNELTPPKTVIRRDKKHFYKT